MSARSSAARWSLVLLSLGAATCMVPSSGFAQPVADDAAVAKLETALRPGDKVTVSLPGDARVSGHFIQVSPEFFTIQTREGRRDLAVRDVNRVRRTRMGVLVGPLIGGLVGVGLGALAYHGGGFDMEGSDWLLIIGISAGVGLGIDAAVNRPRTVYERSPAVAVTPIVTPHAAGVGVWMTF